MLDRHKIISIVLGLAYVVIFQSFSTPVPIFRFLLPAFFTIAGATFFYNRHYLRQINKYNFWVLIRPLLLQSAGFLLLFLLPGPFSRGLFFIMTAFLIAIFEIMLADFSENALLNEVLIVAFGFCFGFLGLNWNFPTFSYAFLAGIFISLFFVARCYYEFVPYTTEVKRLNALVTAFLCAQIFWAITFLPFHYPALAILLFNIFYLVSVLNYHFLFNNLTAKKIKFHLILSAVCLIVVFSTTPWTIVR